MEDIGNMLRHKQVTDQNTQNGGALLKPLIVFWLSGFALLVALLFGISQFQMDSQKDQVTKKLQSISNYKVDTLTTWFEERKSDIHLLTQHQSFITKVYSREDSETNRQQVLRRLNDIQKSYNFAKITVLDDTGKIVIQTSDNIPVSKHALHAAKDNKLSEQIYISKMFYDHGRFYIDLISPIYEENSPAKRYMGAVVFHIDPSQYLQPFVKSWPVESKTAESILIFKKENGVVHLNQRRFDERHIGFVSIDNSAEVNKSLIQSLSRGNESGELQGLDYRNKHTFSYFELVPGTPWILVSKIDRNEVFQSLYTLMFWTSLLGVLALISLGLVLSNILRRQEIRKQNEWLESSNEYFMGLFMNAPVAYQSLDEKGNIVDVNAAWCEMLGYNREEVIGQAIVQFVAEESIGILDENFPLLITEGHVSNLPFVIVCKNGQKRTVIIEGRTSESQKGKGVRTHCVLNDITEQKANQIAQERALKRTQALFELSVHAQDSDENQFLQQALDELVELTDSKIGFVHFVSEDQTQIQLATWSSATLEKYCTATFDSHYPIDKAGIWADCVHSRKPEVVNDYFQARHKKGLPEGHSDLQRFMSIPILAEDKVRMIIGVGNANQDYDDYDVETVQLFGNELYQIIMLKRVYDALEVSEKRFHNLFEKAPLAYQSLDDKGNFKEINEAWLRLFGYKENDLEELHGTNFSSVLTDDMLPEFGKVFAQFLQVGQVYNQQFTVKTKSSEIKTVEVTGKTDTLADGQLITHCALVDVTEKLKADKALQLAAKVYENTGEGLMITDKNCQIISVNQSFTDILGYTEEDILGKTPKKIRSGKHDKSFYKEMWQEINENGLWKGEIWNRHKSGILIPEWLTITKLNNEAGEVERYIGVFADISKLKASEAELSYLASHDILTDLPNRRNLMASIDYARLQSNRVNNCFAILMIDLDRFKEVNDSFGHSIGDEVLVHVSSLLKAALRETDLVARLGGDEFAILASNLHDSEDAGVLARSLIEKVSQTFTLTNGTQISVGCSVGISLYPEHSSTSEELMQQADTALYLSKQKGRGNFEYFTSEMTIKAQNRIKIETELKNALNNNELRVYFQPQVDIQSGKIKGAEALIRWQHPERGIVSPIEFIPIAEESALIADIGEWVLIETCRQAKEWLDKKHDGLVFAVNVSAKQLVYTNLFDSVMKALSETQLPAEMLELELTESALMLLGDELQHLLDQLRGVGVRIAIDDFGIGYSSLAYLKSIPLDVLKIDKSFVDDIPHNKQGMQIVNTIISMAHNLRLDVLAEGVENEEQKTFLALKGCDFYQGYLTSKPISPNEFEQRFLIKP
ncbi:MAG: EAL domain-containing protein [Pseudomonadota bacterium]|nr:EAL domain-containing protein [Pseudomonadota bacterium]